MHHEAHVLLAGEQEGNYADYGSVEGLARELPCPERERLVVCAQNHDQVGNWAMGESTLRCYRELLALRREPADTPVEVDPDSGARMLRFRRGGVELVANFDDQAHDGVPPRTGVVRR